jgi:imidazolonepropionase-like amidohydrolase
MKSKSVRWLLATLPVEELRIEHVTIVSPERSSPLRDAEVVVRKGLIDSHVHLGEIPTYANPPGLNGRLEMQRLVDSGVTPAQIFQAATLANARALKLDRDIGTVSVGKRANLLLLRSTLYPASQRAMLTT